MDQYQTAYTFVLKVYWPTIMLFLFLIHLSGKNGNESNCFDAHSYVQIITFNGIHSLFLCPLLDIMQTRP